MLFIFVQHCKQSSHTLPQNVNHEQDSLFREINIISVLLFCLIEFFFYLTISYITKICPKCCMPATFLLLKLYSSDVSKIPCNCEKVLSYKNFFIPSKCHSVMHPCMLNAGVVWMFKSKVAFKQRQLHTLNTIQIYIILNRPG